MIQSISLMWGLTCTERIRDTKINLSGKQYFCSYMYVDLQMYYKIVIKLI